MAAFQKPDFLISFVIILEQNKCGLLKQSAHKVHEAAAIGLSVMISSVLAQLLFSVSRLNLEPTWMRSFQSSQEKKWQFTIPWQLGLYDMFRTPRKFLDFVVGMFWQWHSRWQLVWVLVTLPPNVFSISLEKGRSNCFNTMSPFQLLSVSLSLFLLTFLSFLVTTEPFFPFCTGHHSSIFHWMISSSLRSFKYGVQCWFKAVLWKNNIYSL